MERTGRIKLVKDGVLQGTAFLDIDAEVDSDGGEQGLLGLAFPVDYETSGSFYIDYTGTKPGAPQPPTRICRVQRNATNPDLADAGSLSLLLEIAQPFSNHNGGMVAFGPDDYLYIGMGDGGSGNDPNRNAQNLNALLGKILRIDVVEGGEGAGTGGTQYDIPPSNPFATGGGLPEIWDYGMRNPFRFSFDKTAGDLWIGDVGQNAFEEIDFEAAGSPGGRNYGWAVFEAARCNTNYTGTTQTTCDELSPDVTFPVYSFANPSVGNAVIGGYVYRGAAIPELQGTYFFSDAGKSFIKTFTLTGGVVTGVTDRTNDVDPLNVLQQAVSFGEDNDGELYLADLAGAVYKIVPVPPEQGEGELEHYTADVNSNNRLSLSEVLRVIQFYNSDGFYCAAGTEDGYSPGAVGNRTCIAYDSDYDPQNWRISLNEVLRVIQLYNTTTGFQPCENGEDGFCSI
nr:hypothetical protein [uncultured bacterium]